MGRPRVLTDNDRRTRRNVLMQRLRTRNPEKYRKVGRDWMRASYHSDPDARARRLAANRKWVTANREQYLEAQRNRNLGRKYGITAAQYDDMLAKQQGCCAICQRSPEGKRLAVDHDHRTGRVRGLLCDGCNRTIGMIESYVGSLVDISLYLMRDGMGVIAEGN